MAEDDARPVRRQVSKRPRPLRAEPLIEDERRPSIPTPPPPLVTETPPPRPAAPSAVVVEFEGPTQQRRVTVAFRVILAIPHFLVAAVLGIVAEVVVVIAWFAALFTGRVPEGIAQFVGAIIQYTARVYAYGWLLLSGKFPSFAVVEESDGAVNVRLAPGRLNRAAVFFRLVLIVPAAIVIQIVTYGLMVASFVIWLIVLIMGRLPVPLFEAEAAILRYQIRFYAYLAMLTSEYPRGLLGDRPSPAAADDEAPAVLPARPRIIRLVLSKAGRRIVILVITLGVVFGVGLFTAGVIASLQSDEAFDAVTGAHSRLEGELGQFSRSAQTCAVSGGVDCIHAADNRLADAFEVFQRDLRDIEFSAAAQATAEDLDADTDDIVDQLRRLATITSPADYQSGLDDLQRLFRRFDNHYEELVDLVFF